MALEVERLATVVAEAACRLQDAIAEAEKAGLQIEVSSSRITTKHVTHSEGNMSEASAYLEVRTTIGVKTSLFLSMGGK